MGTFIRFPKHQMICAPPPNDCLGGCKTCGGWEGEVPTDCPGVPMSEEQKQAVMDGRLDYLWREGWTTFTRLQRLRITGMIE